MEWEELDGLITEFEARVAPAVDSASENPNSTGAWREIWALAARIQEAFRDAHYPEKDLKDQAWSRFSGLRKTATRHQQTAWKQRAGTSREHREQILAALESARLTEFSSSDRQASEKLKKAGAVLKQAADMLTAAKEEMLAEHKQDCFKALQEIRRAHDKFWSEVRQERTKARSEMAERASANLEKNRERLGKAQQALVYYQGRAEEMKEKIATAWNEEWKARAGERLIELEARVLDIQRSITQIEAWVAEDEKKIKRPPKAESE
jgi:hypothetical protein